MMHILAARVNRWGLMPGNVFEKPVPGQVQQARESLRQSNRPCRDVIGHDYTWSVRRCSPSVPKLTGEGQAKRSVSAKAHIRVRADVLCDRSHADDSVGVVPKDVRTVCGELGLLCSFTRKGVAVSTYASDRVKSRGRTRM